MEGLEAVSTLVPMASNIQKVTVGEYIIPYTGGDTTDVIKGILGPREDALPLKDSCPIPQQKGGAINVVVETAAEVISLARDGMEMAYMNAAKSEEKLEDLAGELPYQAVLLAARIRFTKLLDAFAEAADAKALAALKTPVDEALVVVEAALERDGASAKTASLEGLRIVLKDQQTTADALGRAAATGTSGYSSTPPGGVVAGGVAAVKSIVDSEVRFYYIEDEREFVCTCLGRSMPLSLEYDPSPPLPTTEDIRQFRQAFFEAFDLARPKTEGPKVVIATGTSDVSACAIAEDLCRTLGVLPVVLQAEKVQKVDTFWLRMTTAAKAFSGGSLAIVIVDDATRLHSSTVLTAVESCKEQRVALVLAVKPDTPHDYVLSGHVGRHHIAFRCSCSPK
eukprot:TRINITY_DN38666_c0_g1_i1.p1 TRINITY_DN38666_c0_g1~~TRINITY_DN38666_c0_g1_i1.p1  ORF type:complete len:452 (-),score=73.46 TRINITY_DN38666_c0_g1_i1:113-1297(-)